MFGTNRASILRQDKHYLQTESNGHPLEPRHLGVPSCVSRTISEPMVRLAQTMHLSCTDTKTISKWTETRFHMTHIIEEFHRVHPKRLLSLKWKLDSVCLEIVLILMQDRCMLCVKRTTGSEIVLDAPDATPRPLGSCGISFWSVCGQC
jgi:hypothetical protein